MPLVLDPMAPFTHWCTVPFRDGGRMPIGFRATGIDVLTPPKQETSRDRQAPGPPVRPESPDRLWWIIAWLNG